MSGRERGLWVFLGVLVALLALGVAGCDRCGAGGVEELAQVGDAAPAPSAAEGEAAEGTGEEGAERDAGSEGEAEDASADAGDDAAEAESDAESARRILALDDLMQEIGYARAGALEASEFVIAPPGAEGAAGRFTAEAGEVAVAAFVYPNARFAAPHVSDIRAREEVLDGSAEMVVHDGGRLVLHLRATSARHAQDVGVALHRALGWTLP